MNRRVLLAIFALAVLAAGLVLYIKLQGDDAASASPQRSVEPTSTPAATDSPPRSHPTVNVGREPRTTPSAGGVQETTINGVRIRDHRTGDHPQVDLPANIHPPGTHRVAPALTAAVSTKLQAVMHDCIASLPKEQRGEKPRLEGTIQIAIKDHQARVTQSAMQLRQVEGPAAEPTKQCIEEKSLAITTPAPDEPDLESYSISITFALL